MTDDSEDVLDVALCVAQALEAVGASLNSWAPVANASTKSEYCRSASSHSTRPRSRTVLLTSSASALLATWLGEGEAESTGAEYQSLGRGAATPWCMPSRSRRWGLRLAELQRAWDAAKASRIPRRIAPLASS
jgi:hypothetical protein